MVRFKRTLLAAQGSMFDSKRFRLPAADLPSVRVRRAAWDDVDFIASLARGAFAEFGYRGAEPGQWMAEHFHTWVAVRRWPLDAKQSGGAPRLGFLVANADQGVSFEISAIAVAAGERGRGVGAALLETAERYAAARGARRVVARTADANTAALQLFMRRGYRIRRRLPGYYGMYSACELVLQCRVEPTGRM